jgi:hypothetical protein
MMTEQAKKSEPLVTKSECGVWMRIGTGNSVARLIAEQAMLILGLDPSDWRLRDKLILGIDPMLGETLDSAVALGRNEPK